MKPPFLAALLAALLLTPHSASSQTTYRVAGTVISATEGHPLARTRVSLLSPRTGEPVQSMLTADDGHFEFRNIPAGKYPLHAEKRGYFPSDFNQHEQFSTAIVTGAANVDTEHLVFRIPPLAQISGQILDERGDPVRNARVTLWHYDHNSGVARIRRFSNENTDDLGSYEFATLPPGTYFLSVSADPWYAVHPHSNPEPQDVDRSLDVVYPTTYYSGATESEDATPLLLRGGDRLQIDLHLLPVAALHVIFHSANPDEFSPTPILFKHVFDDLDVPQRQTGQMTSPGIFEIVTAPGRFHINLPATPNSPARASDLDITQDNQELDPTSGDLLASVSVTVEMPGESQLPQPLLVSIRDSRGGVASTQNVDPQGSTQFNELAPGKYTLSAFGRNQAFAVSRVTLLSPGNTRGRSTAGNTLNLSAGTNLSILLTLTGGSTSVEGVVTRDGRPFAGAMVVLVPAHPELHSEFFRRDQSDLDGTFALPSVVPGTYTAVAIEDGWDLDWSQTNVIARYAAHGQKITIPANAKTIHFPTTIELQPK